jgi:selenide, water dikinase
MARQASLAHLVLLGGGHAHLGVLDAFGRRPEPGLSVTLIARDVELAYSGMLPGQVAGIYQRRETHIDLAALAERTGARLIQAEVDGIDLSARSVAAGGRQLTTYDLLSVDIGAAPAPQASGIREHAIPIRPFDEFLYVWDTILAEVRRTGAAPRIVVLGAGAGAVELCLAIHAGLCRSLPRDAAWPQTLLVAREFLPRFNARARRLLAAALDERGIERLDESDVIRVESDGLACAKGRWVPLDQLIVATGPAAPAWLTQTGLDLDSSGFIAVQPTLRSTSDPRVFAAGDIATVVSAPSEKSGVFAVRQGAPLAANLRRAASGQPLQVVRQQKTALALVGTGDRRAVAIKGPFAVAGTWVWHVKEWIDRRWIARFQVA